MAAQASMARGLLWALAVSVALVIAIAAVSLLLPTTAGRVIGDLWVHVMSAIAQLLGG